MGTETAFVIGVHPAPKSDPARTPTGRYDPLRILWMMYTLSTAAPR